MSLIGLCLEKDGVGDGGSRRMPGGGFMLLNVVGVSWIMETGLDSTISGSALGAVLDLGAGVGGCNLSSLVFVSSLVTLRIVSKVMFCSSIGLCSCSLSTWSMYLLILLSITSSDLIIGFWR